jgi:RNA polymerase sigma factor (sigma-70 family)
MPTTRLAGSTLDRVLQAILPVDGGDLTDDQLLARYIGVRDQRAFTALVHRHGPMVLGVCRRVLRHTQDADDAFQAAFVVLARKAHSAVPRGAVGNWLYGVAYRTALEARSMNARRRQRERPLDGVPHPETSPPEPRSEVLAALDRELSRLPEKYRQAVVLCELEGRTRKEVARQLGLAEGTLSWRLAAARKMLARRLKRYGSEVAGAALAAALANTAAARVPTSLVGVTVRAVAGDVPARVTALTQEVLKAMFVNKLKKGTVVLFFLGLLTLACGALAQSPADGKSDATAGDPVEWRDDPLYRVSEALVSWWPADGHAFDVAGSLHGTLLPPVGFDNGCRGRAFSFAPAKGAGAPPPVAIPGPPTDINPPPPLAKYPGPHELGAAPIPVLPGGGPAPIPALPGGGPAPIPALPGGGPAPIPALPPAAVSLTGEVAMPASELNDNFTMALWAYPKATACLSDNGDPQYTGCNGQRYAVFPPHGGLEGKRAGCGMSVGTNGVGLFEHTHNHCPCVVEHKAEIKAWTHIAVVYAKGTPTLYVNGTAVKTGTPSRWVVFPGTAFGDNRSNYGPYHGLVDEAALFSRALTAEEVNVIMRATRPEKAAAAAAPLSDADFARLWSALGGERAPRSLFVVQRLAAGGDDTVRRLRERLLPRAAADNLAVDRLIADLDDDEFETREQATQSLTEKSISIAPRLREALQTSTSAEVRARLQKVLHHMNIEELRAVRAITVLVRIDSAASETLLARIARGPEDRPQTVAARGALAQADAMKKRPE